jgi:hypothetical protein
MPHSLAADTTLYNAGAGCALSRLDFHCQAYALLSSFTTRNYLLKSLVPVVPGVLVAELTLAAAASRAQASNMPLQDMARSCCSSWWALPARGSTTSAEQHKLPDSSK